MDTQRITKRILIFLAIAFGIPWTAILVIYLTVRTEDLVKVTAIAGIFLTIRPFDNVFSFGIGIYAVVVLAVIALFILRNPIWREKGSRLPEPAPVDLVIFNNSTAAEKAAEQAVSVTSHRPGTAL